MNAATFIDDASRVVDVEHLCNILVNRWRCPPETRLVGSADPAYMRYTYNPAVFRTNDPFYGGPLLSISLNGYVQRQLKYSTMTPFPCAVMALRLMERYHSSTMGVVDHSNAHLLFATALLIANKVHGDELLSWQHYCHVVGASSPLLSNLEVIMLFENRLDVIPNLDEYSRYRSMLLIQPIDKGLCFLRVESTMFDRCNSSNTDGESDSANTPESHYSHSTTSPHPMPCDSHAVVVHSSGAL